MGAAFHGWLHITIVSIRGRVNFLQLKRHSCLNEKTFRNNFSKEVDWIGINEEVALRESPDMAHRVVAIAIDPAHISKAGNCTPGIARYWSGVAGQAKRGLEITAIAAIDFTTRHTVMLGAEQTLPDKNGKKLTMDEFYIQAIKDNKDKLQRLSNTLVADAFFARKPFADAMVDIGFTFVSRFASNCVLKYLPNGQWLTECGVKPGKKPKYAGKVDVAAPDRVLLHIAAIPEASRAWIGIVWSNALKRKVRVVIVTWDEGNRVVYFSTDTEMDAADIVAIYRCRFQIEFGIRDSRQFTGLHHSQSRSREWLVFAFNISFFARNVLQTEIDRYFPRNSVGQLKNAISDTEFALRILEYAVPNGINERILNKIDHMIAAYVEVVA
ncbi:transposase [uncultured Duncaniella sp.]|uniref:transposase n=1 Tax=uncultured Duncaniella sp. TaxID=2768039 RepID=UPI0026F3FD66|nr:transposase [uncultured Duncaniella sp.]